jgi:hypothetical protein
VHFASCVRARAVRRMGELLKQFDGRGDHMKKDGAVLSLTQKQIADELVPGTEKPTARRFLTSR